MQAIVLKRADFRESDQIITLLTLEKGKVTALARGVKKITSKNSAYLEPFFLVEVEIIPGKDIMHITKVVGVNSFKNIRADLQKSVAAQRIVVLTDKLLEENEADAPVFNLLKSWLESVEEAGYDAGFYFGYIVRLFKILGFTPVLDKCVACGKAVPKIQKKARLFFSPADGGLQCSNCRQNKNYGKFFEISSADRNDWQQMLNSPVVNWPAKVPRTLEMAIRVFVELHSSKKLAILSQIL